MNHSVELKRADGKKIRLTIRLDCSYSTPNVKYTFEVETCEPRKKTWMKTTNHDDYTWRRMNPEQREAEDTRRKLLHVTQEEVQTAMLELWEKTKPNFQP